MRGRPAFSLAMMSGLLAATAFAAGGAFSGCGDRSAQPTGRAGTGGQDASRTAGTGASTDGSTDASYPASVDGRCVAGAFPQDGVCTCQPATPSACSKGCTNTDTDPDNCGGCDRRCGPTSTCNAGACGPVPVTVVEGGTGCTAKIGDALQFGLGVAVAGGKLYVADAGHGTVTSRPMGGGATTTIASGEAAPHALAVAGASVVWINSVAGPKDANGAVAVSATLRGAAAGGAAVELATGLNEMAYEAGGVALSLAGDTVYYSTGTTIMSVPIAGGAPTLVGQEDHGGLPGPLALDGAKLAYPTGLNGDVDVITLEAGKVARCGRNGMDGELDPALQINCLRVGVVRSSWGLTILARADRVYWVDGTSIKANDTGPGASRSNDIIATSTGTDIRATAMSASNIYFTHDDVVERAALPRNTLSQPIARGQSTPASIAVDASKVYWGNDDDCTISATDL